MSHRCDTAATLVFLVGLLAHPAGLAAEPAPGSNALPPEVLYSGAPPEIRDYLLKARDADRIADPLARCLAFPAPPGSHWPTGLIRAHCNYVFSPRIGLKDIQQKLDGDDLAGLEKIFQDLLERHFSEDNFSEDVHAGIALFDGSYEAGRLSKLWLEKAPDSPFALTARAHFYESLSWAARGDDYADDTPKENLDRMAEFQAKAMDLYAQALDREPRMLPAYVGLVDINYAGKARFNAGRAFERGRAVDPACKELLSARMGKLRPRWGGSYPQMLALEKEILPLIPNRPLLALSRIWPYEDVNDALYEAGRYDEAVVAMGHLVASSSSPRVFESIALAMAAQDSADRWLELAYLVEATRFRTGGEAAALQRARRQLWLVHDYEMANASVAAALSLEPENPLAHFMYAASFWGLRQFDEAEREYLIAMKDPDNRKDSLAELSRAMLDSGRKEKAKLYVDMLTKEYPDFARGWWLQALVGTPGLIADVRKNLETFLAKANPNDPYYAADVIDAKRWLERMKFDVLRTGGTW